MTRCCNSGDVSTGTRQGFQQNLPRQDQSLGRHDNGNCLGRFLAARIGMGPPATTRISTLRCTSSARRLREPVEFPVTYVGTRLRCFFRQCDQIAQSLAELPRNGRTHELEGSSFLTRYPIRGTFCGCCASTEKQRAKSMAQSVRQKTFFSHEIPQVSLLIILPLPAGVAHSSVTAVTLAPRPVGEGIAGTNSTIEICSVLHMGCCLIELCTPAPWPLPLLFCYRRSLQMVRWRWEAGPVEPAL